MSNKEVRITIRLPHSHVSKLDKEVEKGKYDNRSQAIRYAIGNFIEDKTNSNAEKVIVSLPKNEMQNLDTLVRMGEALDRQDLLRIALRDYVTKLPFKRVKK